MMAFFHSDIDIGASEDGMLYHRLVTEGPEVQWASDDIRTAYGEAYSTFNATWVGIVTFDRVTYSQGNESTPVSVVLHPALML